jgi:hypothetical protein
MSDDFIQQFDPPRPPRPELTAAIQQRLTQSMKTTIATRVWRAAALSGALVALSAAVLFTAPATHAFADSIVRQFGSYLFVQGTPPPELPAIVSKDPGTLSPEAKATLQAEVQAQATLQATLDPSKNKPTASENGQPANDAAAASQLAGFSVVAPAYLPGGYTASSQPAAWRVTQANDGLTASIHFDNEPADGFLVIEEQKDQQPGAATTVSRPSIQDVTVRGQLGAWMPDDGGKSTLAWEENGIAYLVTGNALPQAELLKVAESLGK